MVLPGVIRLQAQPNPAQRHHCQVASTHHAARTRRGFNGQDSPDPVQQRRHSSVHNGHQLCPSKENPARLPISGGRRPVRRPEVRLTSTEMDTWLHHSRGDRLLPGKETMDPLCNQGPGNLTGTQGLQRTGAPEEEE